MNNFFLALTFLFVYVQVNAFSISNENINDLRPGRKNETVRELKENLNKAGYFDSVDGDFTNVYDEVLFKAIKSFQAENDLKVSGQIDKETMDLLNEMFSFINEESTENYSLVAAEKNYFETGDANDKYSGSGLGYYLGLLGFSSESKNLVKAGKVNNAAVSESKLDLLYNVKPKYFLFRCFLDEACINIR